jgi:hypothetical protein
MQTLGQRFWYAHLGLITVKSKEQAWQLRPVWAPLDSSALRRISLNQLSSGNCLSSRRRVTQLNIICLTFYRKTFDLRRLRNSGPIIRSNGRRARVHSLHQFPGNELLSRSSQRAKIARQLDLSAQCREILR